MASHELESLPGIGPATARALVAAGFVDRDSISSATVEQLVAVKGFAEARASALIAEAQRTHDGEGTALAKRAETTAVDELVEAENEPPTSKGNRAKKRKKRKELRTLHAELSKGARKARKKSKMASSKKKRKQWAAEADRLAKNAKKAKKRLARLG